MIALVQRVTSARVEVDASSVGEIAQGVLVLLGVEKDDDAAKAQALAKRVAGYRIFTDAEGKMNLDLKDIQGSALVVSQFTLAADTRKGRRPSFSSAATPDLAETLYGEFCQALQAQDIKVQTGRFGADMQVHLVNDGPVTFQLSL